MSFYDVDWINLDGNWIHRTAIVTDAVHLGKGNVIGAYSVIGSNGEMRNKKPEDFKGVVYIGDNNVISEHVTIQRPYERVEHTVIGSGNIIMAHAHIGHNARIYQNCEICTSSIIGGHAVVESNTRIKLGCVVRNRIAIYKGATIGMGSVVTKDIPPGVTAYGNPAKW